MIAFRSRLCAVLISLQLISIHSIPTRGGKVGGSNGEVLLESSLNPGYKALYDVLLSGNFVAKDTPPTVSQTELKEAGERNQFIKEWVCEQIENQLNLTSEDAKSIVELLTRWNTASVLSVHIKVEMYPRGEGNCIFITFLLTPKNTCDWLPVQQVVAMLIADNRLIDNPDFYSQDDFEIKDSDQIMIIWTECFDYTKRKFTSENVMAKKLQIDFVDKVHKICIWDKGDSGTLATLEFTFSCSRIAEEAFIPVFHKQLGAKFPESGENDRVKYIAKKEDMEPGHCSPYSHVEIKLHVNRSLDSCITPYYLSCLHTAKVKKIYLLVPTGNNKTNVYYVYLIPSYL